MPSIEVLNLTFSYPDSYENIFENVYLSINTNWKLGLIGRNGRGKTTFLNLLMNKFEYSGQILSDVEFQYFPYKVKNVNLSSFDILKEVKPEIIENFEEWKLKKEISLLEMDVRILDRPFGELSKGEQTRVLLAILFVDDKNFLLIDEPTNHLDYKTREIVANYLNSKKGFILVSHDRMLLEKSVDYLLSINKSNIELQKGNFSSWLENKEKQDGFELRENKRLKEDIKKLEDSSKQIASFATKTEKEKYRDTKQSDNRVDKGFIGKKSAKLMQRAMSAEKRKEEAIREKSQLLKNVEFIANLKMNPLKYGSNTLINVENLEIYYNNKSIFKPISFLVNAGDRVHLKGENGSGKSSIIKLLMGETIDYKGSYKTRNDLKISYISQDTSYLKGSLKEFIKQNKIDETLLKVVLSKLGFSASQFEKNLEDYSEGQKKKILIAKSLCEEAHLYIWDEPLNYIDFMTRIQIENLILEYKPTIIFIEHDEVFASKIANKTVFIKKFNK